MSKKPDYPEEDLPLMICNGDPAAFRQLYKTYFRRLFVFALRFLKSEELAEDVVQEVFLKIWENRGNLGLIGNLKSYLFTACRNMSLNVLSRAARDASLREKILIAAAQSYDQTEEQHHQEQCEQVLCSAIESLPPKRQRIFRMIKTDGKSYEQVAAELGISTGTINDHIVKATKSIRAFLLSRGIQL